MLSVCIILVFLMLSFIRGDTQSAPKAPIKLKLISMYPKDALRTSFPLKWMEKVNKEATGIDVPEIVSTFQALDPIEKGTFDIVRGTGNF